MGDNHRGICLCKDEKTMRVYNVVGNTKPNYMDISNFPTSYYNPCRKDKWNVVCVVYDVISSKSSLWVSHGKICDFTCFLPLKPSTLNLFYRVVHFNDAGGFNSYIESVVFSIWSHCCSNDLPVKSIKSRNELMVAL